jgi:hypothetical protein
MRMGELEAKEWREGYSKEFLSILTDEVFSPT